MDIKQITPTLWVSPQIAPADVEALAGLGVRAIVNDRPDGEEAGQPDSAEIADAAGRHGIGYRQIPVKAGEITDRDVDQFAAAIEAAKGPVLAFCRTGTRAVMLWALSQAGRVASDELIRDAARHGYDITALKPRLDASGAMRRDRP
ncbi:TIGR01244 family sulfur transferase [Acidomonas methanolica]|uniref:TIGR01244 family sulfur transferase n=1 Tax=Acidomonas methanolica TaxID=437 RepID=UPI002119F70C|nr:TIGR01244 family sulfur transferase [Acidomonas methanolica]MCQ9157118.1 TIGR01244 family phosphatase [Acidomonas methanolica]